MGFILSKFKKSKPSIKDSLENIDKEIKGIHRFHVDTELQQKRIIGQLILFSSIGYLLVAICVYLFAPNVLKWKEQLVYAFPFVIFPFIVYAIRHIIKWWYERKIIRNKEKAERLKKERQQMLDDVMENETFKVAKEILEKYAPVHLLPKYLADQRMSPLSNTPVSRTPTSSSYEGLRRRSQPIASTPMTGATPRMMRPSYGPLQGQMIRQQSNPMLRLALMPSSGSVPGGGIRGPAPIPSFMLPLPPSSPQIFRKSGWMDKLVDYVIGDGAANRYALICRYCATHNGLAPQDEFPYIGYRCIYCRQYNPPRQVRPQGPSLPKNQVVIEEMDESVNNSKTQTPNENNEVHDSETDGEIDSKNELKTAPEDSECESDTNPIVVLPNSSTEGSLKDESEDNDTETIDEKDELSLENELLGTPEAIADNETTKPQDNELLEETTAMMAEAQINQ